MENVETLHLNQYRYLRSDWGVKSERDEGVLRSSLQLVQLLYALTDLSSMALVHTSSSCLPSLPIRHFTCQSVRIE